MQNGSIWHAGIQLQGLLLICPCRYVSQSQRQFVSNRLLSVSPFRCRFLKGKDWRRAALFELCKALRRGCKPKQFARCWEDAGAKAQFEELKVRLLCPQPQYRRSELGNRRVLLAKVLAFSRAHQKLLNPSRGSLPWASAEVQERQSRPAPCQPCIGASGR